MPIIESYNVDHNHGPRNCQHSIGEGAKPHPAELILHTINGRHEMFLCKQHAAQVLSHDVDRLATAVIEIALHSEKAITIG